MDLTRQELEEWKRNPVTQRVLSLLDDEATRLGTAMLAGATLEKQPAVRGGTSWTVGALYGLGFINTIETEGEGDDK